MVVVMEQAAINNLLGRGSSDRTVASFRSGDTLHARVTQGIVVGAVGDLLILNGIRRLERQGEDIFREETRRSETAAYEERMTVLGDERARVQEEQTNRLLHFTRSEGVPPPLVREPGESDAVFAIKQAARDEYLRDFHGRRE